MAEALVLVPWRRGRRATARLYASFARLAFLKFLAYRLRYYTGVVSYTIFVAGNYYLYRALFASRAATGQEPVIGGLTLGATITYVIMSWVGRSFTFNNIDRELASSIQQGDIAMRLVKPFHVQSVLLAEAVGEAVFRLMMFTLPILVVVIPVFGLQRPADPARYGWTLLSFMLGLAINSQINFLLGCLAFELKSIWGVLRAKGTCIDFLSGVLIPFTFFPTWVQTSVQYLPFQGISYVPVMIYLERDPGGGLASSLLLQAGWALGLFVTGRFVWTRAVRRVTLQGG